MVHMKIIVILFYIVLIAYAVKRICNTKNNENEDINFFSVSEKIEYLNELKQQLDSVEQLITDIELCSPEIREKVIKLEWITSAGEKKEYSLWIDGTSQTTEELLKIAYIERQRLRTSLHLEIKNLSDRCNENCNENYSYFKAGEGHYNG